MFGNIRSKIGSIFHRNTAPTTTVPAAPFTPREQTLQPLAPLVMLTGELPLSRAGTWEPPPRERAGFGAWLGRVAGSAKTQVLGAVAGAALLVASAIATPQQSMPPEVELATKAGALVEQQYGGDYQRAFDHYSRGDGAVDSGDLSSFLEDAQIGNFATRSVWVSGVLDRFDASGDRQIDWPEFERAQAEISASPAHVTK